MRTFRTASLLGSGVGPHAECADERATDIEHGYRGLEEHIGQDAAQQNGEVAQERQRPALAAKLEDGPPEPAVDLQVRLWDPSTQLRYRSKTSVPPRPDGAPNRVPVG